MDKVIRCCDCQSEFIFTIGEQKFYEERGFSEPKRCAECRKKRKEGKQERSEHHGRR